MLPGVVVPAAAPAIPMVPVAHVLNQAAAGDLAPPAPRPAAGTVHVTSVTELGNLLQESPTLKLVRTLHVSGEHPGFDLKRMLMALESPATVWDMGSSVRRALQVACPTRGILHHWRPDDNQPTTALHLLAATRIRIGLATADAQVRYTQRVVTPLVDERECVVGLGLLVVICARVIAMVFG